MRRPREHLQIVECAERQVHGKSARHGITGFDRILRPGMPITPESALLARHAEDIRVAGIKTLERGLLIPRDEGRYQMPREVDEIDVTVEGRPVLLAESQNAIRRGELVGRA